MNRRNEAQERGRLEKLDGIEISLSTARKSSHRWARRCSLAYRLSHHPDIELCSSAKAPPDYVMSFLDPAGCSPKETRPSREEAAICGRTLPPGVGIC